MVERNEECMVFFHPRESIQNAVDDLLRMSCASLVGKIPSFLFCYSQANHFAGNGQHERMRVLRKLSIAEWKKRAKHSEGKVRSTGE
jgi:hypothetical protein